MQRARLLAKTRGGYRSKSCQGSNYFYEVPTDVSVQICLNVHCPENVNSTRVPYFALYNGIATHENWIMELVISNMEFCLVSLGSGWLCSVHVQISFSMHCLEKRALCNGSETYEHRIMAFIIANMEFCLASFGGV